MRKNLRLTLPLLCIGAGITGCQTDVQPAPESVVADEMTASTPPPISATQESAPRTPDIANPKDMKAVAASFTPPFPDRLELFEPPKRAQGTVRRDDEHGETVELKGFIDVDQPKVVLSIDGVISPVPEGGEKYGVHVISIQPPSVVLQRGRNRWTATLE
jgi:hypothetical protein